MVLIVKFTNFCGRSLGSASFRHSPFSTIKISKRKLFTSRLLRNALDDIGHGVEPKVPNLSNLSKPLLFTLVFSTGSFTGAAIWQYENLRSKVIQRFNASTSWFNRVHHKHGKWRNDLNRWWNSLSEGDRMFIPICALNALIFLGWRVPKFQPYMVKYFTSNPAAQVTCWPMVLSTFSHYSALHLFANMYVLRSFSTGAVYHMGKEQFIGFYLAAGVISSFTSLLYKSLTRRPGISLGASGAIMGVLGYTCTQFPDLDLSIIFFPYFTFKAALALKALMCMDAAGIILGWKVFDHAAHLGGAVFGIFWAHYGARHLWDKKKPIMDMWHGIRDPPRN